MAAASARFRPAAMIARLRDRPPVVPVIRLYGTIGRGGAFRGGLTLAGLAGVIQKAFSHKRAPAVALAINSPGGSPVQSALIARRIRDLSEEKKIPVLAFCEDVAASGGYWLATAADEIFVDDSTIVGSIGVIAAGFGFHEAIGRYGIERRVHTAGARKAILDPFQPEDPEDVALLHDLQADVHASFKAQVRGRRGDALKGDEAELFSGRFWTGRRAVELGLADGIGHLRPILKERFGEKVRMRPMDTERGLLRRRFGLPLGRAGGAGPDAAAIESLATAILRDGAGEVLAALEERALWQRYGL